MPAVTIPNAHHELAALTQCFWLVGTYHAGNFGRLASLAVVARRIAAISEAYIDEALADSGGAADAPRRSAAARAQRVGRIWSSRCFGISRQSSVGCETLPPWRAPRVPPRRKRPLGG